MMLTDLRGWEGASHLRTWLSWWSCWRSSAWAPEKHVKLDATWHQFGPSLKTPGWKSWSEILCQCAGSVVMSCVLDRLINTLIKNSVYITTGVSTLKLNHISFEIELWPHTWSRHHFFHCVWWDLKESTYALNSVWTHAMNEQPAHSATTTRSQSPVWPSPCWAEHAHNQ
jgi:hypothetical protein